MLFEAGVDMLDHCGQGGALAAPGRTGQQHNAARRLSDVLNLFEQAQLLEAGHVCLHIAHRQAPLTPLLEQVRSEPSNIRNEIGKVRFSFVVDLLF